MRSRDEFSTAVEPLHDQDTSRAKQAAKKGPVFITDRGRPSHAAYSRGIREDYQRPKQYR